MSLRVVKHNGYNLDSNHNPIAYNPYVLENDIVQRYDFYVVEELRELPLYWDGDECLSASGGWEIYDIGVNVPVENFIKESDHMEVNCPNIDFNSNLGIRIVSSIDMTGYTKLCFDVSFYRTNKVYGGTLGYYDTQGGNLLPINSTTRTVIKQTIPFSANINNSIVICHAGAGANKLNIYRVWLEI